MNIPLSNKTLPDVTANSKSDISSSLQWVGMEGIAVPISVNWQANGLQTITAKADVFVNIDNPKAKGIHMSRLHLLINQLAERECNQETLQGLLDEMVHSQSGISNAAKIKLTFDVLLKKTALLSGETGYQSYPTAICAQKTDQGYRYEFDITIPYSSTCPCSASLARQLYSGAIDQEFPDRQVDKDSLLKWIQSEAGSVATPHSQRSYAYIQLSFEDNAWLDPGVLIQQLESVIGTPVQTAVKRSDCLLYTSPSPRDRG